MGPRWHLRPASSSGEVLCTDEAMLFGMVEPMSCPTGPNEPLRLPNFDPHELVDPVVTPMTEELPTQLHGPARDPEEDEAGVLEVLDGHATDVVVRHGAVRQ